MFFVNATDQTKECISNKRVYTGSKSHRQEVSEAVYVFASTCIRA